MTAFKFLSVLFLLCACGEKEELVCKETVYCCSFTCATQAQIEERGPDNCDCEADPDPPDGECKAVEDECDWVVE